MIKRKGIKQIKRLVTPYMNDGTRKRRAEGADCLLEKFETNQQMIEVEVFQIESDFPLQIPITVKMIGQKKVYFFHNHVEIECLQASAHSWFLW